MQKSRKVGRAAIPRRDFPPAVPARPARPAGKATVGKAVGKAVRLERAHTQRIRPAEIDLSRPVFVDPSGVRLRHLRRFAYLLAVLLVAALALVWWSQFGGTSRPPAGTPCSAAADAWPDQASAWCAR